MGVASGWKQPSQYASRFSVSLDSSTVVVSLPQRVILRREEPVRVDETSPLPGRGRSDASA